MAIEKYSLNSKQFEKLMSTLDVKFVATADGQIEEDGSRDGRITLDGGIVAQLTLYGSKFNRDKIEKVVLETGFREILETLKKLGIRPEKIEPGKVVAPKKLKRN